MRTSLLVCVSIAAAVAAPPHALAADPAPAAREPGDLWEVTSTMTVEGMNFAMPPQTQKVCAAREWTKPPMDSDEKSKCETMDFKNTPTKSTWKVRCAGPPAMAGSNYKDFCVEYASNVMAGGENDPSAQPPADEADANKKEEQPETGKTKKILKGLFKR